MTTPIPESRGIRKSVQKKGRLGLKGDMRVKIERRCNSTYIPISSFTMHPVAGDNISHSLFLRACVFRYFSRRQANGGIPLQDSHNCIRGSGEREVLRLYQLRVFEP